MKIASAGRISPWYSLQDALLFILSLFLASLLINSGDAFLFLKWVGQLVARKQIAHSMQTITRLVLKIKGVYIRQMRAPGPDDYHLVVFESVQFSELMKRRVDR